MSAAHRRQLILEVAVCLVFTPPHLDYKFSGTMLGGVYTYSFDDLVVVASLAKCYVLVRIYYHFSRWRGQRAMQQCK